MHYVVFEEWKAKFERQTDSSFVKATGEKAVSGNTITYYYCNRSGPSGHNARALKSHGTAKLDGYCTASIVLVKSDVGTHLTARVCSTHHGHSLTLDFLRLQKNDRYHIAANLSQGVTFERILDDIRESIGESVGRVHLTTRKDIQNIERAFGLRQSKRHQDDATSV